eukprot:scaffold106887_cov25-Prasinocladus_malaysianus.AAC.1
MTKGCDEKKTKWKSFHNKHGHPWTRPGPWALSQQKLFTSNESKAADQWGSIRPSYLQRPWLVGLHVVFRVS